MLTLNHLSYIHSNRDVLFKDLNLTINRHDKIALIGNNGTGKSTLLKILAGQLQPANGTVSAESKPYYVPQHFGQFNDLTLAQALRIDTKLKALKNIVAGCGTESDLLLINDDWLVEERCSHALTIWDVRGTDLDTKMEALSGGQKTKVFLAGIHIHQPDIVLLDEPSNHLDLQSRNILYDYVRSASNTLVIVSHDKTMLNLVTSVYELEKGKLTLYGGNYDFYAAQKQIEITALQNELKNKEKVLRKAKEVERETIERKQKLDARGRKKQVKSGVATIMLNAYKNQAEKSASKIKDIHAEKTAKISNEINNVRNALPDWDKIKINLNDAVLHSGKKIVIAAHINFSFHDKLIWEQPLTFTITSGKRIAIKGANGSGKTTLIKIILGSLQPKVGSIDRVSFKSIFIDQDYSLIDNRLSVYEQVQQFNSSHLGESELKIRLNRFLFAKESWNQPCSTLSGGEKMRLMLCCLTIDNHAPDLIVLDEPTNNLDIQNKEILTQAIKDYKGTLIVVSHDERFLQEVETEETIMV
jgi:ATPase subunit of ABC transporter with duplicated ATPase domains